MITEIRKVQQTTAALVDTLLEINPIKQGALPNSLLQVGLPRERAYRAAVALSGSSSATTTEARLDYLAWRSQCQPLPPTVMSSVIQGLRVLATMPLIDAV